MRNEEYAWEVWGRLRGEGTPGGWGSGELLWRGAGLVDARSMGERGVQTIVRHFEEEGVWVSVVCKL